MERKEANFDHSSAPAQQSPPLYPPHAAPPAVQQVAAPQLAAQPGLHTSQNFPNLFNWNIGGLPQQQQMMQQYQQMVMSAILAGRTPNARGSNMQQSLGVASAISGTADQTRDSAPTTPTSVHDTQGGDDSDDDISHTTELTKRNRANKMRLALSNFFARNRKVKRARETSEILISDSDDDGAPQPPRDSSARRPPKPKRSAQQPTATAAAPPKKAVTVARPSRKTATSAGLPKKTAATTGICKQIDNAGPSRYKLVCWVCKTRKPNSVLKCEHAYCLKCIKRLFHETKPCPRCPKGKCAFRTWELLYF